MNTFHIRNPRDLAVMAALVCGYHPEDSVVMLTLDGSVSFHARVDLPPAGEHLDQVELVRSLGQPAIQHDVTQIALVFYTADRTAMLEQLVLLAEGMSVAGINIAIPPVRVDGGQVYDVKDSVLGPLDFDSHPLVQQAGVVMAPSRESLADELTSTEGVADELIRAATERIAEVLNDRTLVVEEARWLLGVARSTNPLLLDEDVARFAAAMCDLELRDAVLSLIRQDTAKTAVDLYSDLVARTPDFMHAPLCAVLALAAWQAGDGTRAWVAVDKGKEVAPEYTLLNLMDDMLRMAVPPSGWEPATDLPILKEVQA